MRKGSGEEGGGGLGRRKRRRRLGEREGTEWREGAQGCRGKGEGEGVE